MPPRTTYNTESRLQHKIDVSRSFKYICRAIGIGVMVNGSFSAGTAVDTALTHPSELPQTAREAGTASTLLIAGTVALALAASESRRQTALEIALDQHRMNREG